jgi:hypothetical protein
MSTLNRRYPAIQGELEDEYEFEDEYETGFEGEAGFEGEEEIEGEGAFESESEEEFEFEFETAAEAELEAEGELEDEFEDEDEDEAEGFVNPIRRIYRDAETMAHLARQAAMTESEGEAEAFIGALVPLAAKLIPRAARLIARNAPTLVRSARRITRNLRRDPTTRRLVQVMPVVLQRTAQSLADQAATGQPINADTVTRTLSTMTGRVLRGRQGARAVQAVDIFDRRWHRRARWADRRGLTYRRDGYGGGYSRRVRRPYVRRSVYGRLGYVGRR